MGEGGRVEEEKEEEEVDLHGFEKGVGEDPELAAPHVLPHPVTSPPLPHLLGFQTPH